jgi:hypothetical protein
MASLAANIAPQHATSVDLSHAIMAREGYQRDDWRFVTLNDAVEDALSKILRFGFDIDRDTAKLGVAKSIKDQILAWAKHIAGDIPGYSNWQEIDDFTFDALYSPDFIPGEDATPIGTEADFVTQISDPIHVHKANLILTPETASDDYRRKLLQLSEADLDQLFHNIPDYPRTESQAAKLNAVINQAISAARDWQTRAVQNRRPIYTGTSGHMLSYARIFLSSEDPSGCRKKGHPNVEQLRLTLLAAMIGFNQHHTYDECMTASHGLTQGGVTVKYKDHVGYRDIIDSKDSFIQNQIGKQLLKAMIMIGKEVIANFNEQAIALDPPLPSWDALVAQWFKDTTGRDFPAIN